MRTCILYHESGKEFRKLKIILIPTKPTQKYVLENMPVRKTYV